MTIEKPPYGSPCNSCGKCCEEMLCPLAVHLFGTRDGPCPALQPDGEMRVCGLVVNPERHASVLQILRAGGKDALSEAAALLIGAGTACDALLKNEPDNPEVRKHIRKAAFATKRSTLDRACRAWGIQ